MVRRKHPARTVRPTLLVVGEGYAEERFLRHIRSLYTDDLRGSKVSLGNAHGYGAKNVIDHAIRLSARASYDRVAVLFDTDTDWTEAVRKNAETNSIALLLSEPCLEAWLLTIVGRERDGTTQQQKAWFLDYFGADANTDGLFAKHFPRDVLDAARERVKVLRDLLNLLGV